MLKIYCNHLYLTNVNLWGIIEIENTDFKYTLVHKHVHYLSTFNSIRTNIHIEHLKLSQNMSHIREGEVKR